MRLHHEGLADGDAGAVAGGDQFQGLGNVQGDGLFAEHVLPGLGRADGERNMEVIGKRIVDGLDFRIGEHLFVRAIGLGDAEVAGGRFGLGAVA